MGRQSATVRDIASVAGVSAASVSRTLRDPLSVSERTRELVQGAMEQIEVARGGRSRRAVQTIGCLFVDATSGPRFSGFDATIWGGLARVAMRHGAEVLLMNVDQRRGGETVADLIAARGVHALAVRCDHESEPLFDEIARAGIPAIAVAHKHDHPGVGYVCVSSRESSRDGIEHLIQLGHRRIAFCRNVVPDQDHAERFTGYRDALSAHAIEPDASLEITATADADGGVSAINRLLALPEPPTAVYFADPTPTIGALRRLHELRISVPEQMSVIGFDDDNGRVLGSPVYTAVCQNAPALAEMTGQLLCRMMNRAGPSEPPRIELDSYLEVNATTGRAPPRPPAVSS